MLMKAVTVGGGGSKTPINLWASQNKSTATRGDYTLSSAVENFEEIMITYRNSTTDSAERSVTFQESEIMASTNNHYLFFGGFNGSTNYVSYLRFDGGTAAFCGTASQVRGTGTSDNYYYPVSIDGFK